MFVTSFPNHCPKLEDLNKPAPWVPPSTPSRITPSSTWPHWVCLPRPPLGLCPAPPRPRPLPLALLSLT